MNLLNYSFLISSIFFSGCFFPEPEGPGGSNKRSGMNTTQKMLYDFHTIGNPPQKIESFDKTQISRIGFKPSENQVLNKIRELSKTMLHDPFSAQWEISAPIVKGWMNHGKWSSIVGTFAQRGYQTEVFNSDIKYGWLIQGRYNAKNIYGAYVGFKDFQAQWVNGDVFMLDISQGSMNLHYIRMGYLSLDDFMGTFPEQSLLRKSQFGNSRDSQIPIANSSDFESQRDAILAKWENKQISAEAANQQLKALKAKYGK